MPAGAETQHMITAALVRIPTCLSLARVLTLPEIAWNDMYALAINLNLTDGVYTY